MVADQMGRDGAGEEELSKVRMTPDARKKLVQEFATKQGRPGVSSGKIEEEVSVNADGGVDTGALLTGDADEELRMQDRLAEKATNAKEGKMPRVTVDDIRPS